MNTYTAETLEDALNQAAEEKQVSPEDLHYNVFEKDEDHITIEVFTLDDVKEFLFDYLGDYFTAIDLDIEVAIEERKDGFTVNLNADNNAILIGKMGKTITAFNTVVKAAVNAQFKQRIDVLIDVNHYKEERYNKLRSMAKRIGRQVQKSHVDVELDPMPNDERKVIHKTLNEWHNLKTESEGTGAARHVCIRYVPDEETDNDDTEVEIVIDE